MTKLELEGQVKIFSDLNSGLRAALARLHEGYDDWSERALVAERRVVELERLCEIPSGQFLYACRAVPQDRMPNREMAKLVRSQIATLAAIVHRQKQQNRQDERTTLVICEEVKGTSAPRPFMWLPPALLLAILTAIVGNGKPQTYKRDRDNPLQLK